LDCDGWTSLDPPTDGTFGWCHSLGIGSWIADGSAGCDTPMRVYCLEQFE
jgi:hypothetical protein